MWYDRYMGIFLKFHPIFREFYAKIALVKL
jgi:hypothetical protein